MFFLYFIDDEGINGNSDFLFNLKDSFFPLLFLSFSFSLWASGKFQLFAVLITVVGMLSVSLKIRHKLDLEIIWKSHFSVRLSCTYLPVKSLCGSLPRYMAIALSYSIDWIYTFSVYHFYPGIYIYVYIDVMCYAVCVVSRSHQLISYYTIIWLLNSDNMKGFNAAKCGFGEWTNVENHKISRKIGHRDKNSENAIARGRK